MLKFFHRKSFILNILFFSFFYANFVIANFVYIDYNMNTKNMQPIWLEWAKELQFIAQAGLTYSKDGFDIERFKRIREISAEMLSLQSGFPLEKVKSLFCNEDGFQTPKLDTRAAIFKDEKILLVKEKGGFWSLPGGWVDINQTIKLNTEKEVREEAGLEVEATRIIAIQDRNLHNRPPYAYNICKIFVLCEIKKGYFKPNMETTESNFFGLEELPLLAEEKNNKDQIEMCFVAYHDNEWQVQFD
jgi:ADP-ribose pyrophosphatase YjhB (NUDIX family)